MKLVLIPFYIALSVLATGCDSPEIEKIRINLGPYQYIGIDPQLSFNISEFETKAPDGAYSATKVKYTINIKQNNPDFPLNKYEVAVRANILDSQGSKRSNIVARGTVENGVLSVSNVEELYGLKAKDEADLKSLKMQIESYGWSPAVTYKPFQAST